MDDVLFDILREVFLTEQPEFPDHQELNDLDGWDSMAHMLFITSLEKEYNIKLSGDEIVAMQTVGDVKAVLEKRKTS